MKRTGPLAWPLAASLLAALGATLVARAELVTMYELIELGTDGDGQSRAYALNDTGQVVGWAEVSGVRHSAHWHNRVTTDLNGLVHFELEHFYVLFNMGISEAYAISNADQIVGTAQTKIDCPPELVVTNAYIARPAVLTDLATPYPGDSVTNLMTFANPCSGAYDSAAVGISNRNHVVGWADSGNDAVVPNRVTRAMLVTPVNGQFVVINPIDKGNDLLVDLGTLAASDLVSAATAVNDYGQVTGYSYTIDAANLAAYHAFMVTPLDTNLDGNGDLWFVDGGGGVNQLMVDLGTLGGTNSWGRAISEDGRVVGESDIDLGAGRVYTHAFLYNNGQMSDLGTLHTDRVTGYSAASAINSQGAVVGWAENNDLEHRAFLYKNGQMQDLNDLLYLVNEDGSTIVPTITLTEARDINENGVIVGWGEVRGSSGARTLGFLLNPILVDPSTIPQSSTNDATDGASAAGGPSIVPIAGQKNYTGPPIFGAPDHTTDGTAQSSDSSSGTTATPLALCGTGTLAAVPFTLAGLYGLRLRARRK